MVENVEIIEEFLEDLSKKKFEAAKSEEFHTC